MSQGNGATASPAGTRIFPTTPTRTSADIHRTPPHSVEAEQGVLGSVLISPNESMLECQRKIVEGYFYVPAHETIWTLLVDMYEKKLPIDLLTVTQFLRDRNVLETVGGAGFVTSLFTFVPTAANIGYYLEICRDKFILRQIITICTEGVRQAYEEQDEVNLLLDSVQEKVTALGLDRASAEPFTHIKDVMPGVLEEIENAAQHRGRPQGLATGFVDYDRMTSGLHPGEMNVIAARPSMGKTALAMQIAQYVSTTRTQGKWTYTGVPVAIFSIETSKHRLVRRQMASASRVPIQKMRDGHFSGTDFEKLEESAIALSQCPIYFNDMAGLRLFEFKSRSRYAVARLGVKLLVIDYLQLMKNPSRRGEFSRVLELSEISAGIKEIGRELNVPIIVVAALNRDPEKLASGKPRMKDLRECGAIEYDADQIVLLHRPEVYAGDEEGKAEVEGEAELIIAKQKDGPVGSVWLTFLKEFTRFEDRARADGSAPKLYSNNPKQRQHAEEEDL